MATAVPGRRWAVAVLAAAVLATAGPLTGCQRQVAGTPTYLEGLGTVTATPDEPTATATPAPAPPRRPPRPAPGTVPTAFAGGWRGAVQQPNSLITRWTAVLELTAGTKTGRFTVENWCSGTATVLSANPSVLVLREVIDSDPQSKCANSGVITLRRTSGVRAAFRWVDDSVHSNVATGALTRG
jgi:hypothetical protein